MMSLRCNQVWFDKSATVSTCAVPGNMSTGAASTGGYPSWAKSFKSLASVAGSQETYTTRCGPN